MAVVDVVPFVGNADAGGVGSVRSDSCPAGVGHPIGPEHPTSGRAGPKDLGRGRILADDADVLFPGLLQGGRDLYAPAGR